MTLWAAYIFKVLLGNTLFQFVKVNLSHYTPGEVLGVPGG
jgi:hypothetical protein